VATRTSLMEFQVPRIVHEEADEHRGVFAIEPANLAWSGVPSASMIANGSLVLVFAFMGIEMAVTPGGEIRNPARTVPRAILSALAIITLLYIAVQVVAQGVLGAGLAESRTAPLAAVAEHFHWGALPIFIFACIAIIPLAGIMGESTEHLAARFGAGIGGLMNATFGNAAELIIAMVALYRPGPMAFIPDYIARMHGEADVEYRHPALEPIFQDTFGIPVYQEQLMRAAVELAGYTPSESDELRKAISKKNKKDIDKHRDKFVKGAVTQGMDKATAESIYSDWEEFARYGFNKSHAADYGVIAVQTAYLKANYPAEYMTALLSASASITEKVAFYVADARNMGVRVLPIEINSSGWDFAIEDVEDKAYIRFGFGAVKNVGQGAVELILKERDQNGAFKNLNDFARRVDLRAVGKRALECLIKVGAMDSFGNRAALLASLDRIISISSNHFRAVEAGQMSLFGAATGVVDEIKLPDVNNVDRREMLNWERELIGLYISDHPLTPYQPTFAKIVSYFSGQLGEAQHEEKVRVAGLITAVRPYMTKTNKPMGFVTLEDIQGNIELVLFPRTWEKLREQLKVGQIVIVEGKVDLNSTPPKVLVESIRTEIKILESLDEAPEMNEPPLAKTAPVPLADQLDG